MPDAGLAATSERERYIHGVGDSVNDSTTSVRFLRAPGESICRVPSKVLTSIPDAFDLVVVLLFAGLSIWVWVSLWNRSGPNKIWTGTDGPFLGDQMQFLGWIADSARHVLVNNPFRSTRSAGVFLHPGVVISGLAVRLGFSPAAALLAWTPVAVIVLFVTIRAYIRKLLGGTAQRRVALVLALFYVSPTTLVTDHITWLTLGDRLGLKTDTTEMWPGLYLWGYPFTALAVALMPACLLAYGRDRTSGRISATAPVCGLLCGWLQPWQGATLFVILVGSESLLGLWRRSASVKLLLVNGAAVLTPLVYYELLGRLDSAWAQSGRVNLITYPALSLVLVLAPLGIVGLLAYRLPCESFDELALRVWPVGALLVYAAIAVLRVGTFPAHALQGLSIPFAVLAVTGVVAIRIRWRAAIRVGAAGALVLILLVPPLVRQLGDARSIGLPVIFGGPEPYFLTASEQRAIEFIQRDPRPGAVLAPVYLGQLVPARTQRQTWVGIYSWTPDYVSRVGRADALFSGKLTGPQTLQLVRSSRARFLLSDCSERAVLTPALDPILVSVHDFGCASVYVVRVGR